MKKLAFAAAIALSALGAGAPAHAMPAMQLQTANAGIVQASGGCGPRGHRNPYGVCVPNYYARPVYRACPPGFHLGAYGRCRPNF